VLFHVHVLAKAEERWGEVDDGSTGER